jgi:hypothetical protein
MSLRSYRFSAAVVIVTACIVALFGGCGLSTMGTGTNSDQHRCTAAAQCDDGNTCTVDDCTADGVCTNTPVPDGDGPPSTQQPGSCKKSVCKAGVLSSVPDDQNVSDDGNFCTDDQCKDGTPVHPPKADGTECKVGQATGRCTTTGSGGAATTECKVECGQGLPPCDDKNHCTEDSCDLAQGKCVFSPLDGVKIPGETDVSGDCRTPRCVGGTEVTKAVDDSDLPTATSDCVTPTCTNGTPSLPDIATGTACATSGGTVCDGQGACVECNVEADCTKLPPSNECQTRTCKQHTCGTDFVPDQTPLQAQTPGDCQLVVCDGKGNKVSKADNTDLPKDGNDCVDHLCVNGVPQKPNLALDTKCGPTKTLVCDGQGTCVGCNASTDCAGTDDDCKTRTCTSNKCGFDYQKVGTPLPVPKQPIGNCQQLQCDGSGNVQSAAFDTNLPIDGNDCTKDVCTSGVPSNPPIAADTPCSKGYCDGASSCVQCNHANQCPNPPVCVTATCNANACGTSNVANGTLAPAGQQVPGDCKDVVCDGNGGTTTKANTNDLPNDNNQCTSDTCSGQVPTYTPKPAHTACNQNGGKVCDGNTSCIGCVDDADCTLPTTCGGGSPGTPNVCGCTKKTCAQLGQTCGTPADGCGLGGTIVCNDSQKNGSETDVDCGGNGSTCNVKCGQGRTCSAGSDCSSGNCVDGFCCNSACSGTACKACSNALTGATNGTCSDVKAGLADPRGLCSANDVCVAGPKCECADGVKDGAETAVDCGGSACAKCAQGKACLAGSDCGSGFCVDGYCCNSACSGSCQACSKALSGGTNGTCTSIPAGNASDPNKAPCPNAGDVCGNGGLCRCGDGAKDGAETDKDCGGAVCGKCAQGSACTVAGDCANGNCVDGYCCDSACSGSCQACSKALTGSANGTCANIPAGNASDPTKAACPNAGDVCGIGGQCRCADGSKDGAETSVDCGGAVCGKCGGGKACGAVTDCASTFCVDGVCCDKACSGSCQACTKALTGGTDGTCANIPAGNPSDATKAACASAGDVCGASGLCRCNDGVQDGSETYVDCGGAVCSKCGGGKKCSAPADCSTGFCVDGVCCDKACTGSCQACTKALTGGTDGTCGNIPSGNASDPTKAACPSAGDVCGASGLCRCNDVTLDGSETSVDCGGGVCGKCGQGKACGGAADCASGFCVDGVCCNEACAGSCQACTNALTGGTDGTCGNIPLGNASDPTKAACPSAGDVCGMGGLCRCGDGLKNGLETDVDCGGTVCNACANLKSCVGSPDCTSTYCDLNNSTCYAFHCGSGTKDVDETDTDCGGADCVGCGSGKTCSVPKDCQSPLTCLANDAGPNTCQ